MANLNGYPVTMSGNTTTVDSSAKMPVGTRAMDANGNEYIYIQGTASVVAGSLVTYDLSSSGAATLLAANGVGPVAVFGTAIVAGQYGWAQIYGKVVAKADTVAANKGLYIDNTAGQVDDAGVAGDWIQGACSLGATVGGSAVIYIAYPFVTDGAYLT